MLKLKIPLIHRADEEAMLRAAMPGEVPCIMGSQCRGRVDLMNGFTLPAFLQGCGYCIVCLRANVTSQWLDHLGETKTEIIQPYRVIIGPGEYREDACIVPITSRFDGITDPFVRYSPDTLRWDGIVLVQTNVRYQLIPNLRGPAKVKTQYVMNSMPYVDVTREIISSGLFCHVNHAPRNTIETSIREALWCKEPRLNLESTWIKSLFPHSIYVELNQINAQTLIQWITVESIALNPLLLHAARQRHFNYDEFVERVRHAVTNLRAQQHGVDPVVDRGHYLRMHQEWVWDRLGRLLRKRGMEAESTEALQTVISMHEEDLGDKQLYPFMKSISRPILDVVNRVTVIDAPSHWVPYDRNDLNCVYYCFDCGEFKTRACATAFGNHAVTYDIDSGVMRCFKKKSGGRKVVSTTHCSPLTRIDAKGKVLEIAGVTYLDCSCCGLWMARKGLSRTCAECAVPATPAMGCHLCPSQKNMTVVRTFVNGGMEGTQDVGFCRKHTHVFFKSRAIWSLDLLVERVLAASVKLQGKEEFVQRGM